MLYLIIFTTAVLFLLLLVYYREAIRDMLQLFPFWRRMWRVKLHVKAEKYAFGKHGRQYILYCPPTPIEGERERRHLIVYFHGGGWQFGSPDAFLPAAQVLTDWGFPVVMASHRRLPWYGYRSMREDVSAIIEKTWEIMREKNLTDRDIILGGMSSGGNLAALLYFDEDTLTPLHVPNEKLKAAFLQAAPLDLSKMKPSPVIYNFAGHPRRDTFRAASPISYLKKSDTRPVYLVHGDRDGVVQYECTLAFYEKMHEIGYPNVRFETVPGGCHSASSDWAAEDNDVRRKLHDWLKQFA